MEREPTKPSRRSSTCARFMCSPWGGTAGSVHSGLSASYLRPRPRETYRRRERSWRPNGQKCRAGGEPSSVRAPCEGSGPEVDPERGTPLGGAIAPLLRRSPVAIPDPPRRSVQRGQKPFKTSVGVQFRHDAGRDAHAPGFYLHVEPGNLFVGLGMWHPDGPTIRKVRERIAEKPDDWSAAVGDGGFRDAFGL